MFKIGDVIIYSAHGLCKIDDICEKTYGDTTATYYVLHPLENAKVSISIPVNSKQVVMQRMMVKEEAEEILETFKQPGVEWIDNARQRTKEYTSLVSTGDRKNIAKVAITLMKKKDEATKDKKKLVDHDRVLLESILNIMFNELAASLDTTYEVIAEKVNQTIGL